MAIGSQARSEKYAVKIALRAQNPDVAAQLDSMISKYKAAADNDFNVTSTVQGVLSSAAPVPSVLLVPFYMALGRQFDRIQRTFQGAVANGEAQVRKDAAVTRGLHSGTSINIAAAFGLVVT